MILSGLLLSAWILNTYNENDQKLYMTTFHLKSKLKNRGAKLDEFGSEILKEKMIKSINRPKT